jgi:arylsulfatase A-like enzyme
MVKNLTKIIILSIAFLVFGCKKEKPNIIFFIADDMYPNMFNNIREGMTEDGSPKNLTPTLDSLIKEGVWLKNMKVVSPVCTPSRYNCLTGNYASRAINEGFLYNKKMNDGQAVIQWNSFIVPGMQKTMGDYFQDLGYKTGFVGKNHVVESLAQIGENAIPDLDADPRDPEVIDGLEYRYKELQKDIKKCGFDYADALYHNNPDWLGIRSITSHNMDWITEKGLEFIDQNKDKPFMLYMATTLPHGPNEPLRSWRSDRRITARGILDVPPNVMPQFKGELSEWGKSEVARDSGLEPTVRNIMSIYRRIKKNGLEGKEKENLLWLDDAVGALIKKLEETGEIENTIFVFFNDHGQELKGTLYEGGINSEAFIWKKGGFKVGNVLEAPVSNVDFLPTLLELAGDTENLNDFDGYSFKAALDGKKYKHRKFMYHELGYVRAIVKDGFKYYSIRYPEWAMNLTFEERKKILDDYNNYKKANGRPIINSDPMQPFGQLVMVPGGELAENPAYTSMPYFTDPDQFYDLNNDPDEMNNLIGDPKYTDKIEELKNELHLELERLPGNFEIFPKHNAIFNDPELEQSLKSNTLN